MKIVVLRIGHRPQRDQRITTHVGLTARALGASGMLLCSDDTGVGESITDIAKNWGGDFYVRTGARWKTEIQRWKDAGGKVIHLTMYGINLPDIIDEISDRAKTYDLMIIVGAEKVPSELYELADWNVAIGNQPHSEVAALAIVLDRLQRTSGNEALGFDFPGAKLRIVPMRRGKKVIEQGV